jgi:putative glutamine amidotransferase
VRRLGRGLEAVAWAPDGAIEAVEQSDADWLFAVQWHPEMDPDEAALFQSLVARARRR